MIPATAGRITFAGKDITSLAAHEVARLGLAHCMEGRHIFADLTVHENLVLAGTSAGRKDGLQERLDRVYDLFEVLAERRNKSGKQLSGGQQQQLAIGRSLMADPKLIIFDEIALGLAPTTVDRLYDTLVRIRDEGTTMILIEQNVERGLSLADRVFVLEKGTIALGGTPDELRGDPRLEALYMGEAQAGGAAPGWDHKGRNRDTRADAGHRRPCGKTMPWRWSTTCWRAAPTRSASSPTARRPWT